MASERSFRKIVLAFNTLGLEKAEEIAGRIKVSVDRATNAVARGIKTRTRDAMKELRILKNNQLAQERSEKAAAALKGRNTQRLVSGLEQANTLRSRIQGFSGSLSNLADLAGLLGPEGRIAQLVLQAVVIPAVREVEKKINEETDRKVNLLRLELTTQMRELAYELDYEQRLKDDPAFANAEAKKAFKLAVAEEQAAAADGWHPGADFLESFGD